jgi:hypothetical protein
MNVSIQGSGAGVTAESIGAAAPVCAPKSAPVVDALGNWDCQTAPVSGGVGGGSSTLLMVAALAAGYWWFKLRGKGGVIA